MKHKNKLKKQPERERLQWCYAYVIQVPKSTNDDGEKLMPVRIENGAIIDAPNSFSVFSSTDEAAKAFQTLPLSLRTGKDWRLIPPEFVYLYNDPELLEECFGGFSTISTVPYTREDWKSFLSEEAIDRATEIFPGSRNETPRSGSAFV